MPSHSHTADLSTSPLACVHACILGDNLSDMSAAPPDSGRGSCGGSGHMRQLESWAQHSQDERAAAAMAGRQQQQHRLQQRIATLLPLLLDNPVS